MNNINTLSCVKEETSLDWNKYDGVLRAFCLLMSVDAAVAVKRIVGRSNTYQVWVNAISGNGLADFSRIQLEKLPAVSLGKLVGGSIICPEPEDWQLTELLWGENRCFAGPQGHNWRIRSSGLPFCPLFEEYLSAFLNLKRQPTDAEVEAASEACAFLRGSKVVEKEKGLNISFSPALWPIRKDTGSVLLINRVPETGCVETGYSREAYDNFFIKERPIAPEDYLAAFLKDLPNGWEKSSFWQRAVKFCIEYCRPTLVLSPVFAADAMFQKIVSNTVALKAFRVLVLEDWISMARSGAEGMSLVKRTAEYLKEGKRFKGSNGFVSADDMVHMGLTPEARLEAVGLSEVLLIVSSARVRDVSMDQVVGVHKREQWL